MCFDGPTLPSVYIYTLLNLSAELGRVVSVTSRADLFSVWRVRDKLWIGRWWGGPWAARDAAGEEWILCRCRLSTPCCLVSQPTKVTTGSIKVHIWREFKWQPVSWRCLSEPRLHNPALEAVCKQWIFIMQYTGGADKSLARPGRKQATATEDFEFHISYL
jgi:hypothetical protein